MIGTDGILITSGTILTTAATVRIGITDGILLTGDMDTAGTIAGMTRGIADGMIRGIMAVDTAIGDHLTIMVDIMEDITAVAMDTGMEAPKVYVTTMAEDRHPAFPVQEIAVMAEAVPVLMRSAQQRPADTAHPVTAIQAEAADTQLYHLRAVLLTCIIAMEDAQAVIQRQPITTA